MTEPQHVFLMPVGYEILEIWKNVLLEPDGYAKASACICNTSEILKSKDLEE